MGVFGSGYINFGQRMDTVTAEGIYLEQEISNFNRLFNAISIVSETTFVYLNEEEAKKTLWEKIKDLWHRFTEWVKKIWNKIFHKKSESDAEEAVKEVDAAVQANEQNTEVVVEKTDKTTGHKIKEYISAKLNKSEDDVIVKEISADVEEGYKIFNSVFPDKISLAYLYSANLLLGARNLGNSSDTINTSIEDFIEAADTRADKIDKVEEAFKNVTVKEVSIKPDEKAIGKYNNKLKKDAEFYKNYKNKLIETSKIIDQCNKEMQFVIDKGDEGVKKFIDSTLSNSDAKAKEEYYNVMGSKIPGMISKDIARAQKVINVIERGIATCDTILENIARSGDKLKLAIADVKVKK